MAPMMLDSAVLNSLDIDRTCSDPSVIPSDHATQKVKELWWLHGHPHSKRYSNVQLNSLAALIRYDASLYQGQQAFLFPVSKDPSTRYQSMSWEVFDRVTENIALLYASELREELLNANVTRVQPTIALLGRGTTIEYFCTQLALQKLGVRVLLLAESNALTALQYLLVSCSAVAVITDARNASTPVENIRKIGMIEVLPQSHGLPQYAQVDAVKYQDSGDVWERHSFIIHSSGSTGMPKPIIHTNRSMMLIARMYRLFQDFNIENWFLLFPLYHIAGISVALSNLPNGQILSFPPLSWPPSSSSIITTWRTLASMGRPVDCVHCAPTLIENMYEYILERGNDFTSLRALKILQPGGAALSDHIVEMLVANGVNVKTTYGSTEIGPPFRTLPATRDNKKCYTFRNLYPDNPFIQMEQLGNNTFECVVYKGFELAAELWEGKADDEPFRTNDLFTEDPPGSGFFTLQGRRDDVLVHSNGENTSAGPLQLDIQSSSKLVNRVLAVGHSKPCVGLLVELHQDCDIYDEEVHNEVWEAVKQTNSRYPLHSQISQHMIQILAKGSVLPITPKGNVRRKEVERMYAVEIEELFSDSSSLSDGCTSSSSSTSSASFSEFLRNVLASLCSTPESEICDWTNFYDIGVDSRLALSLRASISSRLGHSISLGTIFEYPSISKLVSALEPSSPLSSVDLTESKIFPDDTTIRFISRFESELRSWPQKSSQITYHSPRRETILLTGGSGSLGTSLMESFSASDEVEKIYVLIRGPNVQDKLEAILRKKGIDTSILGTSGKVHVLNFSMQDPLFGLDLDTYYSLATSVTTVIHNAWKMDFNLTVEDFEDDCLRSTMNLLRFCHTGRPKTMAFTSSISTCMGPGHTSSVVSEDPIGSDPTVALPTGYARSKYIIERITQTASSVHSIPIKLLRVGQLCGNTKTGHWNTNEMWPILFSTAVHPSIRAIPIFPGKLVDWVPVNTAASVITEVLLSSHDFEEEQHQDGRNQKDVALPLYKLHNIVNPHPIPWEEVVQMLQKQNSDNQPLEELTLTEWVHHLTLLADKGFSGDEIPGLRLLHFFEGMAAADTARSSTGDSAGDDTVTRVKSVSDTMVNSGGNNKIFDTSKTKEASASLRQLSPFCEEWIERSVNVWKENGFWCEKLL